MSRAFLLILVVVFTGRLSANDSTNAKIPKHYFKNTFYSNYYSTPNKQSNNKQIGSYGFSSVSSGFIIPLLTKDYFEKDSVTIKNFHLLAVGNYFIGTPYISNLPTHYQFSKISIGLRAIYNTGKKNTWFYNFSPFMVYNNIDNKGELRYASVLIFNRTVNKNFSYRFGITKTFLFGNRYRLPIIGFRFGALDGIHLNLTLPRNISLIIPVNNYVSFSLFTKPTGGLYTISNIDTLYNANEKTIQFARYELTSGFNFFFIPTTNLSFFFGSGIARNRQVAVSSFGYSTNKKGIVKPFLRSKIEPSLFVNVGLTLRFGKTKKVYNNFTMYDALDINSQIDPTDNNDVIGSEIPRKLKEKEIRKIKYKDVADLIEMQDIY
ncbi:MAG: hypothetical protein J0M08_07515 [Bacteroidetes bacterium]|nr:hypothetical protein [Bacteroidota bacterium]